MGLAACQKEMDNGMYLNLQEEIMPPKRQFKNIIYFDIQDSEQIISD